MSLKTWRKEYYPTSAHRWMSKKQAIQHSLRKWRGLEKKILKEHGVRWVSGGFIEDIERIDDMWIDANNCALCVKFLDYDAVVHTAGCRKCPLAQHLGKPCDSYRSSPYNVWQNTGNPRPMIKALEATLAENS